MPMTGYLKIEGEEQGEMKGDCVQKGREDLILVYAFEHNVEIPRDTHTGLPTGQRIHHPLTITKRIDPSSPMIYQACCSGEHLKLFDFDLYLIDEKGKEVHYYQTTLVDSIIVDVHTYFPLTFLEKNKPFLHMEEVSFTYSKITWEHIVKSVSSDDDWKVPKV
ncbi:Hcp family type VI secretion system effector [Desulfococcaceae bacterium HSG7]|nr:Hcp family type VI secretion system effector [Desulfococcaceae bacterium HSG7]